MPEYYDVFNGDADGICALHQLRLAEPREAELITGVKRDVRLLQKISQVAGADITVLDISMDSNKSELLALLDSSCRIFYADHHFAGEIPQHENLTAHVDTSADICTSLIIDRLLAGKYRPWAVVAAFGDNLHEAARKAAACLNPTQAELDLLRELGELLNYNGYGRTPEDLHFTPQELYKEISYFVNPFDFNASSPKLAKLRTGFNQDLASARATEPQQLAGAGRIFTLPGEPWSRRVAGVFSNEKAREAPDMATALLVDNNDGSWLVSVRAPLNNKQGADELCRRFPTGGGRAAAAGINALPDEMKSSFYKAFEEIFSP